MLRNVDVSTKVCLLTRVSLADVDSHKVCRAGEFGGHLAKLTKLGHERRSGAGTEVDHQRAAWPGSAEERDDLSGVEVVKLEVGGSRTSLGLLQRVRNTSEESLLQLLGIIYLCMLWTISLPLLGQKKIYIQCPRHFLLSHQNSRFQLWQVSFSSF